MAGKKIKEIVEGWKKVVFTDEEIEKLSDERMKRCNECPSKKMFEMLGIRTEICGECHCPLSAKTRSPKSGCPLNKWSK